MRPADRKNDVFFADRNDLNVRKRTHHDRLVWRLHVDTRILRRRPNGKDAKERALEMGMNDAVVVTVDRERGWHGDLMNGWVLRENVRDRTRPPSIEETHIVIERKEIRSLNMRKHSFPRPNEAKVLLGPQNAHARPTNHRS